MEAISATQGRHEDRRCVPRSNLEAVRDEDVGVVRFGRNESSDETNDEGESVNTEKLRTYGSFFYCSKCGQSYGKHQDALRHWALCNVHGTLCHVVERYCLRVNRLIKLKKVEIERHPESNESLKKIEVTPSVMNSTFGPKWAERPKVET